MRNFFYAKRYQIICFLFLLFFVGQTKAEYFPSEILAVCRVTLTDGKVYEGFITLGYIRESPSIFMNGFYFNYNNNKEEQNSFIYFYNLDFKGYKKNEKGYSFLSDSNSIFENCSPIKYLQFSEQILYQAGSANSWMHQEEAINNHFLKLSINRGINYKLLDSISLYFDFPLDDDLVPEKSGEKEIKLAVTDIKKFELLENPSNKWQEKIGAMEDEAKRIYEENGIGGSLSEWYHEILKDKEKYKYLQPLILFNNQLWGY